MGRIATIALGAFKESVRERVLYNLIVFAFLMIAAAILLGNISVGVEELVLINLGLGAISIFGLLIAIFIGIWTGFQGNRTAHPLQHSFQAGNARGIYPGKIRGSSVDVAGQHHHHDGGILRGAGN